MHPTRKLPAMILIAMAVASLGAHATDYTWSSGVFSAQGTPSPLPAGDTLTILTSTAKGFTTDFENRGSVLWEAGDIGFASVFVTNGSGGLWDAQGNNQLAWTAGRTPGRFINNGTFRKSGGSGNTTISGIDFVNNGVIDAQSGSVRFTTSGAVFNAGTQFAGTGATVLVNNATFAGTFNSQNLELGNGTFTGSGAVASGSVLWTGGAFAGSWTNQGVVDAQAGTGKGFIGAFVNEGTVNWSSDLGFSSTGLVTNNGVFNALGNHSLVWNSGSTPGEFLNMGTFRKSGGGGSTTVSNLAFFNYGILDAQSGEILFTTPNAFFGPGTQFNGAGVNRIANSAFFADSFTSQNLELAAGTFSGGGVVANGTVRWTGGALAGDWTNRGTFVAEGTAAKGFIGILYNEGTVNWSSDLGFSNAGVVVNDGLFDAKGNNQLVWTSGSIPGTFINNGTFRKSSGTGNTTISGITFANSPTGRIESLSGNILITGAFDNLGTVSTARGAAFQVFGAFTNSGRIEGLGTVITPAGGMVNQGEIAPGGSVGALSIQGNFIQAAEGVVVIEIGDALAADLLAITGSASLDGTLQVVRLASYTPSVGDEFQVLTFASRTGQFDQVSFLGFGSGVVFDVLYGTTDVRLQVAAIPEPGTWALMFGGLGLIVLVARRRQPV